MANAFNLTAQLNLRGPANIKPVVDQIRKQLGSINANVNVTIASSATRNVAALTASLNKLNTSLGQTTTSASSAANAISKLSSAIRGADASKLGASLTAAANASNKLAKQQQTTQKNLSASRTEMEEFGKQAALAIRRFAAFSTVTAVVYQLNNAISSGVQSFIAFDKEFVKLQQVTGESARNLSELRNEITRLSTGLGVTSQDLTQVSSTLAQAGLNARETRQALEALALSALAPSFDNLNDTVEGSIALMRQFGISSTELTSALGSVNAVAAAFAVEAGDIIKAIQRTGGVFANASKGVTEGTDALNEFIAVFTSVRQTTRESAETIATGLRTIFTRIQRGSTIQALKEYGVQLTDLEGKFVGPYKAVQLLSEGLGRLDPRDLRFSQIVEELGGFRQIGKVIPLIQQFSVAQRALTVAQEGQSSLAEDAAIAQLSLANQISKVREEFLALFREIGSSDTFQFVTKGALSLTSGLIRLTDSLKNVLPVFAIITAAKGLSAITQFGAGFGKGIRRGGGQQSVPAVAGFAKGGLVPGAGNTDSVPAMLTPGEFVINKRAVNKYGRGNLVRMNRYAEGGPVLVSDLLNRSGAGSIAKAIGSTNLEADDKVSIKIKPKTVKLEDQDFLKIWNTAENQAAQGSGRYKSYTGIDISQKNRDILRELSGKNRSEQKQIKQSYGQQTSDSISRLQSAEGRWGLAYEQLLIEKLSGQWEKASDKTNYPVDIVKRLKNNAISRIGEVKFRTTKTDDADLISKLLRYRIEKKSVNRYFKENLPAPKIDDVNIGTLDYYWAGDTKKQFYDFINKQQQQQTPGFLGGGFVQKFVDGGWVKRMKQQDKKVLKKDLEALKSAMMFAGDTGAYIAAYDGSGKKEMVDPQELKERYRSMSDFLLGKKSTTRSALKPAGGYNQEELLDAVTYYQGGSGPLARAMVNQDYIFVDREEAYETADITGRLSAAAQYKLPKKLYSGLGRGQFNEILSDTQIDPKTFAKNPSKAAQQFTGKTVDFPTFLSTSKDYKIAEAFVGKPGALMSIDSSKTKQKGIDVLKAKQTANIKQTEQTSRRLPGLDKIDQTKLATYDAEEEMILNPNTKFKILSAKMRMPPSDDDEFDSAEDYYASMVESYQGKASSKKKKPKTSEPDLTGIKLDLAAQMLNQGGMIQKFADAGTVKEATRIRDRVSALAQTKQQSIQETLLEQLKGLGGPAGVRTILGIGSGDSLTRSVLNANNIKANKGIETAKDYVNRALFVSGQSDAAEAKRIAGLTQVAIAGLLPMGYRDTNEWVLPESGKTIYATIKGFNKKYLSAAQQMSRETAAAARNLAENMQYADIFDGGQLAFDFDETLVSGTDILNEQGKPDIPRYSDRTVVAEYLKRGRLTRLGEKLKALIQADPEFIKNTRILTARPANTVDLLAQSLQSFGLPYTVSDITGVGGAGIDVSKAKAKNLSRTEKLIDDSLDNIRAVKKSKKSGFLYTEPQAKPELDELMGQGNIEGAVIEKALAILGANLPPIETLESNRAIDFPGGLGRAAQFFGLPDNIPTEIKRTLNGSSFEKARGEFDRYYKENAVGLASGGMVPALVSNGEAYVPPTLAKKIGYSKLNKMNQADRNGMDRFADGGISVFKGPGTGTSDSISTSLPVGSFIIREKATKALGLAKGGGVGAIQSFRVGGDVNYRPDVVTTSTAPIINETTEALQVLAQTLQSLGSTSSKASEIINSGRITNYKSAIDAAQADVTRAKLLGASIAQITAAENALLAIRNQATKNVNTRKSLQQISESQQARIAVATNNPSFEANVQKTIDAAERKRKQKADKAYSDAIASGKSQKEAIAARDKIQLKLSDEQKNKIRENEYLNTASAATGIKRKDLRKQGLTADVIQQYIRETSLDTTASKKFNAEYLRARQQDLQNYINIATGSKYTAAEAKKLAQEELRERKKIAKEVRKSQGLGNFSTRISDFASKSNIGLSLALPVVTDLFAGGEATSASGAATQAATQGVASSVSSSLALASLGGPLGVAAAAGTLLTGLAKSVADARNAAVDFTNKLSRSKIEEATERLSRAFDRLSKDVKNAAILGDIERDLKAITVESNQLMNSNMTDIRYGLLNLFASSGSPASRENSRILQNQGVTAYIRSLVGGAETRQRLFSREEPLLAKENAQFFTAASEQTKRYIQSLVEAGKTQTDLMSDPAFMSIAQNLALADVSIQRALADIKDPAKRAQFLKDVTQTRAAEFIEISFRAKELKELNTATKELSLSFNRLFDTMDQSINAVNYGLKQFYDNLSASVDSLSGSGPKIQAADLQSINILQNPLAYSKQEFNQATQAGSALFGNDATLVNSLLKLGPSLEDSLLSTINNILKTSGDQPEIAKGRVNREVRDQLNNLGLPADLASKLAREIGKAVGDMADETDKGAISLQELTEKISGLSDILETSKKANASVTNALKYWQDALNSYSDQTNKAAELQVAAAAKLRRANDILFESTLSLASALGKDIDLSFIERSLNNATAQRTGGLIDPVAITNALFDLERRRSTQQANLAATQSNVGGVGAEAAIIKTTRELSQTNVQIAETRAALEDLANNSELASAALNKIQQAQQKQAGRVSFIEKLVTSTPEQLKSLNNAFANLQRYASGQTQSIQQSTAAQKAYREALKGGATRREAQKAAQEAFAGQRSDVLSLLNDISPFLGSGQQANNIRANTLETMLRESGIGINPMMQQVLNAVRNPEADPETKAAIETYKSAIRTQAEANKQLARINSSLATDIAQSTAKAIKEALSAVTLKFDDKAMKDLADSIRTLKPAQARADGGIIYASQGSFVNFAPKGTDTVPAMLTPGEFVVNRTATQQNRPLLEAINNGYAKGGKVRYYAAGGYVAGSAAGTDDVFKGAFDDTKVTPDKYAKAQLMSGTYEAYTNLGYGVDLGSGNNSFIKFTSSNLQYDIGNSGTDSLDDNEKTTLTLRSLREGVLFPRSRSITQPVSAATIEYTWDGSDAGGLAKVTKIQPLPISHTRWPADLYDTPNSNAQQIPEADIPAFINIYEAALKNMFRIQPIGDSYQVTEPARIGNNAFTIPKTFSQTLSKEPKAELSFSEGIYSNRATLRLSDIGEPFGQANYGIGFVNTAFSPNTDPQFSTDASPTSNTYKIGAGGGVAIGSISNNNSIRSAIPNAVSNVAEYLEKIKNITGQKESLENILANPSLLQYSDESQQTKRIWDKLNKVFASNSVYISELFDSADGLNFELLGGKKENTTIYGGKASDFDSLFKNSIQDKIDGGKKNIQSSALAGSRPIHIKPDDPAILSKSFAWTQGISLSELDPNAPQRQAEAEKALAQIVTSGEEKSGKFTVPLNIDGKITNTDIPYNLLYQKVDGKLWNSKTSSYSSRKISQIAGGPLYALGASLNTNSQPEGSVFDGLSLSNANDLLAVSSRAFNSDALINSAALVKDQFNKPAVKKYLEEALKANKYDIPLLSSAKSATRTRISGNKTGSGLFNFVKSINGTFEDFSDPTNNISVQTGADIEFGKYLETVAKQLIQDKASAAAISSTTAFKPSDFTSTLSDPALLGPAFETIGKTAYELFGQGGPYQYGNFGINLGGADPKKLTREQIRQASSALSAQLTNMLTALDQEMNDPAANPALFDLYNNGQVLMSGALKALSGLANADTNLITRYLNPTDLRQPNFNWLALKDNALTMFRAFGAVSSGRLSNFLNQTLTPDDQIDLQSILGGKDKFQTVDKTGKIGDDAALPQLSTINDVLKLALNPYNQFDETTDRSILLNALQARLINAKDGQGRSVFSRQMMLYTLDNLEALRVWFGGEPGANIKFANPPAGFDADGLPASGPNAQQAQQQAAPTTLAGALATGLSNLANAAINTVSGAVSNVANAVGLGGLAGMFGVKTNKWSGIDYLYDQTPTTPDWATRLQALRDGFDSTLYDNAAKAFAELGAITEFGTLPSLDYYAGLPAVQYKQTGGMIYASQGQLVNFEPKGTDTVPAMLTPGEFVVNRAATQKHLPLLKAINSGAADGYSRGGVIYAEDGRYIDPRYYLPFETSKQQTFTGKEDRGVPFGEFLMKSPGLESNNNSIKEGSLEYNALTAAGLALDIAAIPAQDPFIGPLINVGSAYISETLGDETGRNLSLAAATPAAGAAVDIAKLAKNKLLLGGIALGTTAMAGAGFALNQYLKEMSIQSSVDPESKRIMEAQAKAANEPTQGQKILEAARQTDPAFSDPVLSKYKSSGGLVYLAEGGMASVRDDVRNLRTTFNELDKDKNALLTADEYGQRQDWNKDGGVDWSEFSRPESAATAGLAGMASMFGAQDLVPAFPQSVDPDKQGQVDRTQKVADKRSRDKAAKADRSARQQAFATQTAARQAFQRARTRALNEGQTIAEANSAGLQAQQTLMTQAARDPSMLNADKRDSQIEFLSNARAKNLAKKEADKAFDDALAAGKTEDEAYAVYQKAYDDARERPGFDDSARKQIVAERQAREARRNKLYTLEDVGRAADTDWSDRATGEVGGKPAMKLSDMTGPERNAIRAKQAAEKKQQEEERRRSEIDAAIKAKREKDSIDIKQEIEQNNRDRELGVNRELDTGRYGSTYAEKDKRKDEARANVIAKQYTFSSQPNADGQKYSVTGEISEIDFSGDPPTVVFQKIDPKTGLPLTRTNAQGEQENVFTKPVSLDRLDPASQQLVRNQTKTNRALLDRTYEDKVYASLEDRNAAKAEADQIWREGKLAELEQRSTDRQRARDEARKSGDTATYADTLRSQDIPEDTIAKVVGSLDEELQRKQQRQTTQDRENFQAKINAFAESEARRFAKENRELEIADRKRKEDEAFVELQASLAEEDRYQELRAKSDRNEIKPLSNEDLELAQMERDRGVKFIDQFASQNAHKRIENTRREKMSPQQIATEDRTRRLRLEEARRQKGLDGTAFVETVSGFAEGLMESGPGQAVIGFGQTARYGVQNTLVGAVNVAARGLRDLPSGDDINTVLNLDELVKSTDTLLEAGSRGVYEGAGRILGGVGRAMETNASIFGLDKQYGNIPGQILDEANRLNEEKLALQQQYTSGADDFTKSAFGYADVAADFVFDPLLPAGATAASKAAQASKAAKTSKVAQAPVKMKPGRMAKMTPDAPDASLLKNLPESEIGLPLPNINLNRPRLTQNQQIGKWLLENGREVGVTREQIDEAFDLAYTTGNTDYVNELAKQVATQRAQQSSLNAYDSVMASSPNISSPDVGTLFNIQQSAPQIASLEDLNKFLQTYDAAQAAKVTKQEKQAAAIMNRQAREALGQNNPEFIEVDMDGRIVGEPPAAILEELEALRRTKASSTFSMDVSPSQSYAIPDNFMTESSSVINSTPTRAPTATQATTTTTQQSLSANLDTRTYAEKLADLYDGDISNPLTAEIMRNPDALKALKERRGFSSGGIVYANNGALIHAKSSGSDTIPAMLTPGEFVINRSATQQHKPLLEAINSGQYTTGGIVRYLAAGGYITPQRLQAGSMEPIKNAQNIRSNGGVNTSVSTEQPSWVSDFMNSISALGPMLSSVGAAFTKSATELASNIPSDGITIQSDVNVTGSVGLASDTLGRAVNMGAQQGMQYTDQTQLAANQKMMRETDGGISFA